MALTTLKTTLGGIPANATSVQLCSVDGSYGIIIPTTGVVAVPANTPVQNYVTGVYQYDISALMPETQYLVSWQITYGGLVQYATSTFTLGTLPQVSDVKGYLRIDASDTSFDAEVQDLMDQAQIELITAGVNPDSFTSGDPLIRKAIITYCKAYFGYDTDNAPMLIEAYKSIKTFLMNCHEYQSLTVALDYSYYPFWVEVN